MAVALAALVGALVMFGGETRAVIALAVFDSTEGLLDQADAPTLLTDVLGVSERYQGPEGHAGATGHGSIGHYKMKLATDPNVVGSSEATSVKVEISVDDLLLDGMTYDQAPGATISAADKAEKVVELCVKGGTAGDDSSSRGSGRNAVCGAADSGWGNSVTLYFASANGIWSGGNVGIWNSDQTVSVRAIDDDIADVRDRKTVRISHAYTGYSRLDTTTSERPGKIRVTVTDNDDRGIVADDATPTVTEGNTTPVEVLLKLQSRPQLGSVDVNVKTVNQDNQDNVGTSADDILWRLSSTTCPAPTGDPINNYFSVAGGTSTGKELTFDNHGVAGWNVDQRLCLLALEDTNILTESVTIELETSNATATKTDYDTGFVKSVPGTSPRTDGWTPAYPDISPTDDGAKETLSIVVGLSDNDAANVGVSFTWDNPVDSPDQGYQTIGDNGITLSED